MSLYVWLCVAVCVLYYLIINNAGLVRSSFRTVNTRHLALGNVHKKNNPLPLTLSILISVSAYLSLPLSPSASHTLTFHHPLVPQNFSN